MPEGTICVDFDGVIHSYASGWKGADVIPDPPVEGAIDWLNAMVERFNVVILSTRADQPGADDAIRQWLYDQGCNIDKLTITSHKVPAIVYIDDRAWRFEGAFPDFADINDLKPWNKR